MSIISEALKKANADRRVMVGRAAPVRSGSGAGAGRWVATVSVLAIVVVPFLLPRFLSRTEPAKTSPFSQTASLQPLPMADAPAAQPAQPASGLAQVSVETTAMVPAVAPSPARTTVSFPKISPKRDIFLLQGTVWTENKGRYAILNNSVVREGNEIGSYRVERIGDGRVTLFDGAQRLTIDKAS